MQTATASESSEVEDQTGPSSIFDSIPDNYSGGHVTPISKPDKVEKTEDESDNLLSSVKANGSDAGESGDVDPDQSEGKEKTPAEYARERREAKARRNELLEKAPKLEEENRKLQSRISELEELEKKSKTEVGTVAEDIESLREQYRISEERRKAAEDRYIAANAPQVNPYEDEEVKRHLNSVQGALKTNLPRFAINAQGEKVRVDLQVVQKDPARKGAIDAAIKDYALASEAADSDAMDRAVNILATALGNLDVEDDDLRESLDAALSAASEPFQAGLLRFKAVQDNAASIAQQNRAAKIRETEQSLMSPFFLDDDKVDEALEADPTHPWANFSVLLREMPADFLEAVKAEVASDAHVLGALQFTPPPLPPNATAKEIADHEVLVRASSKRAIEAARYVAVGRALLDGGVLAHLRSQVADAKSRLEEVGESLTIPNRGGGEAKASKEKSGLGMWDDIPDRYR